MMLGKFKLSTYLSGYILSIALTLAAYSVVVYAGSAVTIAAVIVVALALIQFIVQLNCFLHLGLGRASRSRLLIFILMVGIILILVAGSIWIMNNLNYRMTPQQINTYLNDQGGGF